MSELKIEVCTQCGGKNFEDYMGGIRCVDCHRVWVEGAEDKESLLLGLVSTPTHDDKGDSLISNNNAIPTLKQRKSV